ncbi:MAG: glycoside hydrolase family 16 protein [Geminicoccales bacterium]
MADRKDDDSKMLRMPKQKKRPGAVWAVLILLVTASCDNETRVDEVADWGGGTQSPYVPIGYKLAFEDNFDRLDLVDEIRSVADGDDHQAKGWETYFAGWNVRHLKGNNDQALKADASYEGKGGLSLGEHGITLHEVTAEGTLKLYGRPTPDNLKAQFDFPYLGGMISGERLHAQRHGYWELRLRPSNVSIGHHWAFWLIPSDHSWPPEIDMLEVIGSNPANPSDADYFFFNSILSQPNDDQITRITPPRGKDAWYTIGFLWDDQEMRWFLDGKEVRKRPSHQTDKEFYFLMSSEIGGNWVGAPTGDTIWPMEIEVDYIRIYRR